MTRRIARIARALTANLNPAERGVHFHGGPQGAFACTDVRCIAPRDARPVARRTAAPRSAFRPPRRPDT